MATIITSHSEHGTAAEWLRTVRMKATPLVRARMSVAVLLIGIALLAFLFFINKTPVFELDPWRL